MALLGSLWPDRSFTLDVDSHLLLPGNCYLSRRRFVDCEWNIFTSLHSFCCACSVFPLYVMVSGCPPWVNGRSFPQYTQSNTRVTDPGAVPMGARPLITVRRAPSGELRDTTSNRAIRRCHKCNDNYKPNRAHHDSVTGR